MVSILILFFVSYNTGAYIIIHVKMGTPVRIISVKIGTGCLYLGVVHDTSHNNFIIA